MDISWNIRLVTRIIVKTERDADVAFEGLKGVKVIGCDTETSSLTSKTGRLYSIQLSDGELQILVPISEGANLFRLAELLNDGNVVKVFHNAKFDLAFLDAYEIRTNNIYCSMTAERILTKGANQSSSLAETIYRYFGIDLDKGQRKAFVGKWDGVWTDELIDYALSDVVYLPRLMKEQMEWMTRLGLDDKYSEAILKIISRE